MQPVSSRAMSGTQAFWTLYVCSLLGFVNLQPHRLITQRRVAIVQQALAHFSTLPVQFSA